jgi:hypothetical protein
MIKISSLLLFAMLMLANCEVRSQQVPLLKQPDVNALVALMEGSFSSEEQSKNDTDYFDIRLHMKRIWTDRTDGKWLYVEQAVAQMEDKPYRQRIYRVDQLKDGSFISEVYTLMEPLRFAGAWKEQEPLSQLTPDSLTLKEGCAVYLSLADNGSFTGGTRGDGCASDLRGAAYATSEVIIDEQGLKTWDRGYDKDGKQVWGATKGGYIFRRIGN